MSRYKVIGLPGVVIDRIDNWVACAHAGRSVVPRDFYREVDRFEARPEPDAAMGAAVEAIYARELAHCRPRALVLAALIFGAPKGRLRELSRDRALMVERVVSVATAADGVSVYDRFAPATKTVKRYLGKRDADDLLRAFGREVEAIDMGDVLANAAGKIPQAAPMRTIKAFAVAAPRPKVGSEEWSRLHFGDAATVAR